MNKLLCENVDFKTVNCSLLLASRSGKIISCRKFEDNDVKNFYSLISESEKKFVCDNIKFNDLKRFLLVQTNAGPAIIARAPCSCAGIVFIMFPGIGDNEALHCVREGIFESVLISPSYNVQDLHKKTLNIDDSTKKLGKILSKAFPNHSVYGKYHMDMLGVAEAVKTFSEGIFELLGCKVKIKTEDSVSIFMKTELFSVEIIHSTIICLAFCTLKYSANREMHCRFTANGDLVVFKASFEVCKEYCDGKLFSELPEIATLKTEYNNKHIAYTFSVYDGVFSITCSPYYSMTDKNLKLSKFGFDYSTEKCSNE